MNGLDAHGAEGVTVNRRQFMRGAVISGAAAATTRVGGWFDPAGAGGALGAIVCRVGADGLKLPTISSKQSGLWSNASTWNLGRVPTPSDVVEVNHNVRLDVSASVAGVIVEAGAYLRFTRVLTLTLSSTGNVIVYGELRMRPKSASVIHRMVFTGIDETKFVGGGNVILDTDVGLWVMGAGKLWLDGSARAAWNRTGDDPSWLPTDELVVTPVAFGDGVQDDGLFQSFSKGSSVPSVTMSDGTKFTAEVLNLTRNVQIEGTPNGRSHVFIMSSTKQTIRYAAMRYMGPRKPNEGQPGSEFVLGRYGLHLHMCDDAQSGIVLESLVVRDTGSHAFVAHRSHGITFHGCVTYNTYEDAYWWDAPEIPYPAPFTTKTNNTTYDSCVAALVRSDPVYEGYRIAGFMLGQGDPFTNTIKNSVAVAVQGNVDAGGFVWPELPNGSAIWNFDQNVSHNNSCMGATVWQVNSEPHVVTNFVAYHNGRTGVYNGAYGNPYNWSNLSLYGNGGGSDEPFEETQFFMWAGSVDVGNKPTGAPWSLKNSKLFCEGRSMTAMILSGKCPITLLHEDGSDCKPGEVSGNVLRGYIEEAVRFTFEYHDFGPYKTQWHLGSNDLGTGKWFWVHSSTLTSSTLTVDGVGTLHPMSYPTGQLRPDWNAKVT